MHDAAEVIHLRERQRCATVAIRISVAQPTLDDGVAAEFVPPDEVGDVAEEDGVVQVEVPSPGSPGGMPGLACSAVAGSPTPLSRPVVAVVTTRSVVATAVPPTCSTVTSRLKSTYGTM